MARDKTGVKGGGPGQGNGGPNGPGTDPPDRWETAAEEAADRAELQKAREQLRELSSSYAQKSLDRTIWINAGALGALLPIGEVLGADFADPVIAAYFVLSGAFFGLGILLTVIATIFGYRSMDRYRKAVGHQIRFKTADDRYRKLRDAGRRNTSISFYLTFAAGLAFILGVATLFCWRLGIPLLSDPAILNISG